jgi:hypothetical protein
VLVLASPQNNLSLTFQTNKKFALARRVRYRDTRIRAHHCAHSSKAAGSCAGDGPVGFWLFMTKDKPNSVRREGEIYFF